jgi:hypothetical protein
VIAALAGWLRRRPAPTPAQEAVLRRALAAEARRIEEAAAREAARAAATAAPLKERTAMTIIHRKARELHAGDVITYDPDHDRHVRYRVTRPPVRTSDGEYALADYVDLATGARGIGYWPALTELHVEPAPYAKDGGAR